MHKYLVRVLVVLFHVRFSVVGPIPFLLAAFFFPGDPYIGSTTVLPDPNNCKMFLFTSLYPFFSPNFEQSKVNNILSFFFLVNSQCSNGHGRVQ